MRSIRTFFLLAFASLVLAGCCGDPCCDPCDAPEPCCPQPCGC